MHRAIIVPAAFFTMFTAAPTTACSAAEVDANVADQGSTKGKSDRPLTPVSRSSVVKSDGAQDALRNWDRLQDQDCDQTKDCDPILDGQVEPDQDRDRDRDRIVDPDAEQDHDRDQNRIVDPPMDANQDLDQDKPNQPGTD